MASLLPTAAAKGFAAPKSLWTARGLPCVVSRAANQPQSAYRATVAARSFAYDAATAPTAAGAAEIGEVDFEPAAANTVRLIGVMGMKQQMKVFERSKLLPFSLGVKTDRRRPDETEWLQVEVWGPLAERVEQELQKGDRLAVQGRLRVDSWQDKTTGAKRTAYKVVASSISRVRRTGLGMQANIAPAGEAAADGFGAGGYGEPAPWDAPPPMQQQAVPPEQQQMGAQAGAGQPAPAGKNSFTEESLWMDYFTDPSQWYDNRARKTNPNAPDFKKKVGGRDAPALWLTSRSCPPWVHSELKMLDEQRGTA
ncbi:hypothetical protein ABPG77_002839 [Micractinium sp. CCAP 211/92]